MRYTESVLLNENVCLCVKEERVCERDWIVKLVCKREREPKTGPSCMKWRESSWL